MRALAAAVTVAVTAIAPNLPPVKGWPPYPRFPAHSCWARNPFHARPGASREAPSYVTHTRRQSSAAVVAQVLDGLGDKRFIKSVEIGPVPRLVLEHNGWFGKTKPPRTAMWAWLSAPTAVTFEGFFFEARDAKGPFAATFGNVRGTLSGGQWAWNPCHYPYATLGVGINQRC